jgi:hypothetical protein
MKSKDVLNVDLKLGLNNVKLSMADIEVSADLDVIIKGKITYEHIDDSEEERP